MTALDPEPVPKRENKFKAFFRSRSRSRSRSQPVLASSPPMPPSPPTFSPPPPSSPPSDNPPSSYKSSLRPSNRPVSSTTTATHSTITPLPSDSLTNRINGARYAYPRQPQSTDTHTSLGDHDQSSFTGDYDSDDRHSPRSGTPSSVRRMFALHSLFGISLTRRSSSSISTPQQSSSTSERKASTSTSTSESRSRSSRKRSFRLTSRPATPKSIDDSSSCKSPYSIPVPSGPLPLSASPRRRSFGLGDSHRNTPKSSTTNLPLPHSQSAKTGRSHARRLSLGSERPPHDSAVALPEESSHRSIHKSGHILPDGAGRNRGKEREKPHVNPARSPPNIRPSIDFPSRSLPVDPSPMSRNYLSSQSSGYPLSSHLPTVDSASSDENEQLSPLALHRLPVIPKIVHTPPTPQRPGGDIDHPPRPSATPPKVDAAKVETTKGKTVTIAHHEQVIVLNSQSHADAQRTTSSKGRFTPRLFGGKELPKVRESGEHKSDRQPTIGSSDGPTHKTPGFNITGPLRSMTSHRAKLGSFDFERPVSALNRSSSTVDQQGTPPLPPKDSLTYSRTYLPALERTTSEDSARGRKGRPIVYHPGQAELPTLSQIKPDLTGETSVVSFSSLSVQTKSTGKCIGSNTPPGQFSSWGRGSGHRILRTSHGTFGFEHPSSVPSSPNPQTFTLPSEAIQKDVPGHVSGSQSNTPLHAVFDAQVKHSRGQSYNPPDDVESYYAKPSERKSKGKGRSLDLGLGLSWAPSRVREEALMPGFILAREKARLEKNKANGSDVTKVFESLLSESRFQTFKKYVHRFDAHIIPLGGPSGLLARVEKLLTESGLGEPDRSKLMSEFAVFVENHNE